MKKWAIYCPSTKQFVSGDNGNIAWTTDLTEADEMASASAGVVVDAEWLSKNWPMLAAGGVIPDSAKPTGVE